MKNYSLLIAATLLLAGCTNKVSNKEMAANYLSEKGYVADHTIDKELTEVIDGINILTKRYLNKKFVTEINYNPEDTHQILVTPFRKKNGTGTNSGFSVIEKGLVFICLLQIKEFVASNSLNDTADIKGYLGIILLHELSHFALGVSGSFDEDEQEKQEQKSQLGEQDMGTEPEIMTTQKRLELSVDSLAVELVKKGIKITDSNCFGTCMNIQLAINGA